MSGVVCPNCGSYETSSVGIGWKCHACEYRWG